MALADEIRKLDELRQSGALSEDEYARAKAPADAITRMANTTITITRTTCTSSPT